MLGANKFETHNFFGSGHPRKNFHYLGTTLYFQDELFVDAPPDGSGDSEDDEDSTDSEESEYSGLEEEDSSEEEEEEGEDEGEEEQVRKFLKNKITVKF